MSYTPLTLMIQDCNFERLLFCRPYFNHVRPLPHESANLRQNTLHPLSFLNLFHYDCPIFKKICLELPKLFHLLLSRLRIFLFQITVFEMGHEVRIVFLKIILAVRFCLSSILMVRAIVICVFKIFFLK